MVEQEVEDIVVPLPPFSSPDKSNTLYVFQPVVFLGSGGRLAHLRAVAIMVL